MWEMTKSVLLVVLIANSIFMTGYIWMQNYHYEHGGDQYLEEIDYGEPPDLMEQVTPKKVMYVSNNREERIDDTMMDRGTIGSDFLMEDFVEIDTNETESPLTYLFYPGDEYYEQLWEVLARSLMEEIHREDFYIEQDNVEVQSPYFLFQFDEFPIFELLRGDDFIMPFTEIDQTQNKDIVVTMDAPPEVFLVNGEEGAGYVLNLNIGFSDINQIEENINQENLEPAKIITCDWLENSLIYAGISAVEHFIIETDEKEKYYQDAEEDFIEAGDEEEIENEKEAEINNQVQNSEKIEEKTPEQKVQIENGEAFYQVLIETFSEAVEFNDNGALRWFLPGEEFQHSPRKLEFERLEEEKLAKAFFLDLSYVRRIEERDGTRIYTDGQRGLRFYPDHFIQFNDPRIKSPQEPLEPERALNQGANMVSLYGGWDSNLRIAKLNIPGKVEYPTGLDDNYTNLIYEYLVDGLPIIHFHPMKIALSGSELIEYRRQIPSNYEKVTLQNNGSFIPFDNAFQSWLKEALTNDLTETPEFQSYEEIFEFYLGRIGEMESLLQQLQHIYPAYYLEKEEQLLIPVWVLEFDEEGERLMLSAWDTHNKDIIEALE